MVQKGSLHIQSTSKTGERAALTTLTGALGLTRIIVGVAAVIRGIVAWDILTRFDTPLVVRMPVVGLGRLLRVEVVEGMDTARIDRQLRGVARSPATAGP